MKNLKVYVGWDSREEVAYNVCVHSIKRFNSQVHLNPLRHTDLRKQGLFWRPWLTEAITGQRIDLLDGKPFSTEFSHSRFLVPTLQNFMGWALFIDCDMLFLADISKLFDSADEKYAVMVAKQEQSVVSEIKMDGQVQAAYPRKNWSSCILWNCHHPSNRIVTKEFVNSRSGRELHGFSWLRDDEIGSISPAWNWIENVTSDDITPKAIHYTVGGPWMEGFDQVRYHQPWKDEYKLLLQKQIASLGD